MANHHLVSQGYQRNWGDDNKRVTVIDARTAEVVDQRRAIRNNFAVRGFNTFRLPDGLHDSSMEDVFSKIETYVLPAIRQAGPGNAGPQMKADVINLFAMHLVRSRVLRERGQAIGDEVLAEHRQQLDVDEELRRTLHSKFRREYGRDPAPGELAAIAESVHAKSRSMMDRDSMARLHDQIGDKLTGLHLQILESQDRLPGFVLGDVPIVHAHLDTNRYGFAEHLAIGDADLIGAPLTPHLAAFFTNDPLPHVAITTKKLQQAVNAFFIRGAIDEVICCHDDTVDTQRVARQLDRHLAHLSRRMA